MRESIAADHPFELSEMTPAEARAFMVERDQPFKVEIIDDLVAAAERDGTPIPPTTFYRQGPFIDLCRGPHVASTGKIGAVQAARDGRRLLARRREAPDAPAHLRHRLGDPGGPRRVPVAPRGGEEARPPAARRPARPVQLPRRQPRLGLLAPQGPAHLADAGGGHARAPGATRLPGGQHPDHRERAPVAAIRATGTCTGTTCS